MKKGFTLIELLAVIIILAIVALIATPIILDVIDDARESAARSEAGRVVDGIQNYCGTSAMKAQMDSTYTDICADGVTNTEISKMVNLGNATVTGDPTYDAANQKLTNIVVVSNGWTITYNGTTFSMSK